MSNQQAEYPLDEAQLNGLYQYAMSLSRQPDDAFDLLHTALEKYLIEFNAKIKIIHSPESFIRKIIRNRFIDNCRAEQYRGHEVYEEASTCDISTDTLENICIDSLDLQKIWRKLPALDRDILYHWAVLGYSTDEISEHMQLPRGTVLSRIHRLRQKIQSENSGTNQTTTSQSAIQKARDE